MVFFDSASIIYLFLLLRRIIGAKSMALLHSFEKSGNILFRYRGQIPVILFVMVVPVLYFSHSSELSEIFRTALTYLAVIVSLLGFIFRAIAIGTTPKGTSGRNTTEQVAESLNHTGIYSMCRHPLYFGNYFMWIGIVIFTFNIYFVIIVSLAFWLYYERIMFAEERFLARKFGNEYIDWSKKVPAFIPCVRKYVKGTIPFSIKTVLRREYSGILATVFSFAFIDHLRFYFEHGFFDYNRLSTMILAATIALSIFLRTLKHSTGLLNESGRS